MRKQTKTTKAKEQGKLTIYPAPMTSAELNSRFVKSIPKQRDGANSYMEAFLFLMDQCLALYPKSFSLHEAGILNYQGIPAPELERLFNAYVGKLCEWQVVDQIIGCYSYPVYARR